MIKHTDINKATKRKRLWDLFGWRYGEGWLGYLRNNHSLKCGCSFCELVTYIKRRDNKRARTKVRLDLADENKWDLI